MYIIQADRHGACSLLVPPLEINQFCFRKCALDFALYMAITDGIVCKCGVDPDFLGADKEEGSCDVPCPGDGSTMCGAPDSYELFGLIVSSGSPALDAGEKCVQRWRCVRSQVIGSLDEVAPVYYGPGGMIRVSDYSQI